MKHQQRVNLQNIQATHEAHYQKSSPVKKWAENLSGHFSKEDMQVANKHTGRWSTSLIIREIQTKTAMRYHLTPIKMALIKSLQIINAGEGVEKRKASCTIGGDVN